MSLKLLESPNKTISGVVSHSNATEAQLPYKFQREDLEWVSHFNDAGNNSVVVTNPVPIPLTAGMTLIQVTYNAVNEVFNAPVEATILTISIANLEFVVDTPFNSNFTDRSYFIVPSVANYRVVVALYNTLEDTNLLPGIAFKYSPTTEGKFFLDWGQLLTEYQEERRLLETLFKLRYREQWDGYQGPETYTETTQAVYSWARQLQEIGGSNLYQFLMQVNNIPSDLNMEDAGQWGNNQAGTSWVWDVLDAFDVTESVGLSAILTPQTAFVFQIGIEYNIQTVFGAGLVGTQSSFFEIWGLAGGVWELINSDFRGGTPDGVNSKIVHNFTFTPVKKYTGIGFRCNKDTSTDAVYRLWSYDITPASEIGRALTHIQQTPELRGLSWIGWNRTTSFLIDEKFETRTGATAILVEHRFYDINFGLILNEDANFTDNPSPQVFIVSHRPAPANTHYVTLNARDGNTSADFTRWARYQLLPECANPIMLDWLNGYGAPEQHLFNISQSFEREADKGFVFERGVFDDIENVNVTKRRAVRVWKQSIILEADNLTKLQFDVLSELKSSDFIRCYLSKDGADYVEVIVVNDFTDGGQTDENLYNFQVQIEFPNNFDFFKGKLY